VHARLVCSVDYEAAIVAQLTHDEAGMLREEAYLPRGRERRSDAMSVR
jgi:hypothetical protein